MRRYRSGSKWAFWRWTEVNPDLRTERLFTLAGSPLHLRITTTGVDELEAA